MTSKFDENIVNTSVHLSVIEMSLGSLVHAIHLPLGGHLLSLNQGAFLAQGQRPCSDRFASSRFILESSVVVAMMKSFSVAGNKLGPMIAIASQGGLMSLGVLIFGKGPLGLSVGISFLSLWAFAQPLLEYYLLFGNDFLKALMELGAKLNSWGFPSETLPYLLAGLILLKIICGGVLVYLTTKKNIQLRIFSSRKSLIADLAQHDKSPALGFAQSLRREFLRPLFIVSVLIMMAFFKLNGSSNAQVFVQLLRPLALTVVFTYVFRTPYFNRLLDWGSARSSKLQRLRNLATRASQKIAAENRESL
jgi:hypothetical protein